MKRLITTLAVAAIAALIPAAPAAAEEYDFESVDARYTQVDSSPNKPFDDPMETQAGSHPFAQTTSIHINSTEPEFFQGVVSGQFKDVVVEQVAGLTGDVTAYPRCPLAKFAASIEGSFVPLCENDTAMGVAAIQIIAPILNGNVPVWNLPPPPGMLARFGFSILNVRIFIDVQLRPDGEYNVTASSLNIPQVLPFFGITFQLWGDPSDPVHDPIRGNCIGTNSVSFFEVDFGVEPSSGCPTHRLNRPFLTLPTSCVGPVATNFESDAWEEPGKWVFGSSLTHDNAEPPNPQGFTGCGKLQFKPSVTAEPTTKAADSPTGLDFSLNMHDEGLTSLTGLSQSNIKRVEVTLPEGMAANPSLAEGLGVCTEADLERETVNSEPGDGCPNGSKIGTVEVESPEIDEKVNGALFVAKPYENPFDSILALYIVIKNPTLGIIIKQPLNVLRDPDTGQLTTVAEDLPQQPFSRFKLHFREGARSPLSSPPTCGTFEAKAKLYPWSGTEPIETTGPFQVVSGANNGPCPTGGLPSFHPHLDAGTINNAAGRFSPFYARLSRADGEQEITHFSIKLPPGVIGKLAGVPFCSEAQIAQAISRTGPHGGQEELDSPSCPVASEIGRTLAGAGVGPALTYAPGKIYLAGPYNGAPVSIVAFTAGVVGPFDIGTVVVRQALRVNPETGEVFIDATGSDPIPHIIKGFPVELRDIRAYVDRPEFVLNPTDCSPTSTASTLLGAGLDFVSEADDNPITITSPFQAADCASLPFEPKLSLRLKGKTNRGAHPALLAHLQMNGIGEAGISSSQVTLPLSEFIENAHFNTICTRVQFNAGAGNGTECPAGSVYGHAKAITPLLDEPLEGPIFLRSNPERELPDVVAALRGAEIDAVLVGHVDSTKGGGIRTTFEGVPDAPVTSADFAFAGRAKGLFVNSVNLCKRIHRASVSFTGQNGKVVNSRPALKASCKTRKSARRKRVR